jgi:hypothetical protein
LEISTACKEPRNTYNFTPFNLGLALQLYHGYGFKHLIETIHAFGICASYTEVRQFLTSAAKHKIAKTEVSCIPYGISPKTDNALNS